MKFVVDDVLGASVEGSKITLPSFLLEFFRSFEDVLTIILVVGISLVLFQAFRGILMFLNGYIRGVIAENIACDVREELYSHIQNLSYEYHSKADTGDLLQRTTSDVDTVKSFLSTQLPELMYIIGSVVSGALQLYSIDYRIMLVPLIVLPVTITISIIYFKYTKNKFEEIEVVEASMTSVLQENINAVRVVKAFANEPYEIMKFQEESKKFKKENKKLNGMSALYWGSTDFIATIQYVIIIAIAIMIVEVGGLSSGDIIASLMYIGMLIWPVRGLGRIVGDFGKAIVASGRINEILTVDDDFTNDGVLTPEVSGNIEFKNVSYKFSDSDLDVLKDVSFKIEAGETIAIIGKTGSGKSTIVNLLSRMFDPLSGEISIDGVNILEIKKTWLRANVGIILQDPFLYAGTIYDNIKIAAGEANEAMVLNAARIASVHQDISSFKEGYETLVGEKGVTLSGGQKQRVAIARMLLLEKPIVVFDDSLSAVDTITDKEIRKALRDKKKKLTSIIITHEELVKIDGLYKDLWNIQGALEDEFRELIRKEAACE